MIQRNKSGVFIILLLLLALSGMATAMRSTAPCARRTREYGLHLPGPVGRRRRGGQRRLRPALQPLRR